MTAALSPILEPGRDEPMGAQARDGGVNFAVFSQHATRVQVCLFDDGGTRELRRLDLHGPHDGVWSGFLRGAGPGLVYGLRAYGPYAPWQGHRFNPHKLLLDPCTSEVIGRFEWADEHHGYQRGHPDGAASFDTRDNAATALKARVPAPSAADELPRPPAPRHPAADVVLYEVHVKGFSMRHPGVPEALRGTWLGLSHPASVAHFRRLGVTTLSLLPVQQHLDEFGLAQRGLVNHWGYNTIAFNAADPRFATAAARADPAAVNAEFRRMVDELHAAGLEVVLDVVYNHTAEGSELGPTLSFRGLDHAAWYRLDPVDASRCENLTGCGNTLNVAHPRVAQFVLDSLRHWAGPMGVDGFRFDLAPVLGRAAHGGYDPQAAFFTALLQDPLLARKRLIAEPWDLGHAGYQLGRFPGRWLEWNDKFRDTVRRYWLDQCVGRGEFARRFTASSDVFHHGQRLPLASVNFVAAHDGYTLADLTSHTRKRNEPNGEDNRDGRDDELSANFGVEGPSDDPVVAETRGRVRRALLATLLLAQGTPMLAAGDELGHTQHGNNNAYCQDNATTWLDWARADEGLIGFVAQVLTLRRGDNALHHARWFHPPPAAPGERVLAWYAPEGHVMRVDDWHDATRHAFACHIDAAPAGGSANGGECHLWLGFNPGTAPLAFRLPGPPTLASGTPTAWALALDSTGVLPVGPLPAQATTLELPAHALVVLRCGAVTAAAGVAREASSRAFFEAVRAAAAVEPTAEALATAAASAAAAAAASGGPPAASFPSLSLTPNPSPR